MKIGLLQTNPTVGDFQANAKRLELAARVAADQGTDLCVATELVLTGYPPRDLLLNSHFTAKAWEVLEELARTLDRAGLPPLLAGIPESHPGDGNALYNSAALLRGGRVAQCFRKNLLPTYDVFDEQRYFQPGGECAMLELGGLRIGVTVCEDVWNDKDFWQHRNYLNDPVERLAAQRPDAVLNLSASPFTLGKRAVREALLSNLAAKYGVPVLYANQVGGNDDLIFDGRSMVFDATGRLAARAAAFEEDVLVADLDALASMSPADPGDLSPESQTWQALVLGTRDYMRKCGFASAVLGLSGGVDSALTAAVAVEAAGADKVQGVLLPSPYTSRESIEDAEALARSLGIRTHTLRISPAMDAFRNMLAEPFAGLNPDVTEENIQARIRGNLLMALSNKFGSILLTTGNKSELSVGYCTIYGDMAGGLAVLADVPKTLVYSLCRWLNRRKGTPVIPERVLTKPPTAELRPDQKDQDLLPPYEELDPILERLIECHQSVDEIAAAGFDRDTVVTVAHMVKIAEFKRKQAPPGLKITDRAFGTGWRMPIAYRRP